jgi:hypothetical protein
MASRPLDLEWMAKQWAAHKQLGTYAERIATAVPYCLRETQAMREDIDPVEGQVWYELARDWRFFSTVESTANKRWQL